MPRTVDELRILFFRDPTGQPDCVCVLCRANLPLPLAEKINPHEEVVAQGRSIGDVAKALSQFFGVHFDVEDGTTDATSPLDWELYR